MPQDYLMRLIEQIAQMLASILALRRAGRNEEAAQEIKAICLQTAGLPLDRIRKSSPESIAATLATSCPSQENPPMKALFDDRRKMAAEAAVLQKGAKALRLFANDRELLERRPRK